MIYWGFIGNYGWYGLWCLLWCYGFVVMGIYIHYRRGKGHSDFLISRF